MVIKNSKQLCRHILANQHKLKKLIQLQTVRLCSSTARLQEAIVDDEEFTRVSQVPVSRQAPNLAPIKHEKDLGHLFKYSDLQVQLCAPTQLQPKPEADDLKFGKNFTDHMMKIAYHKRLGGWQAPEIVPFGNIVLHPAAKVFHYALELFEGMKAYRGVDDRIRLFRPEMNMHRMNLSAARSGLPTFDGEEMISCLKRLVSIDSEWVPHTDAASLYLRPTLIGIEPTLGVASSDSALLYTILSPVGSYFDQKKGADADNGVSLLADPQYTRAWPGGVGDRKMGSNYAPTIHVQKTALSKGLEQVLWLYGDDHQLTEVGTMNIFMFFINDLGERELITPNLNGLILPGITRDSILALAREWGQFRVTEGKITMSMVTRLLAKGRVLEMFGAGTACIVSPIERIHYLDRDYMIPTMKQDNAVFRRILHTLTDIQYGKVEHPWARVIDGE
ncbi:branched-chain-amino-acid aminotransferase [Culicoides brevitarsis]|uniref:branched-chain-amino-acid aminotransferase n=1 Tax=Culicoides brevitarsis TaxID=469753 RepID=UPI00307B78C0